MSDQTKKTTRKSKKDMPAWQRLANDMSRSVDANLRGKLDIEDAHEMLLEALESMPTGKDRTKFLLANIPEMEAIKNRADKRQGEKRVLQGQVRKLMIVIKFLTTFLIRKGHDVLSAFQKAAVDDAPRMVENAKQVMFEALLFDEGSEGLGDVLKTLDVFAEQAITVEKPEDFLSALSDDEDDGWLFEDEEEAEVNEE